MRSYVSVIVAVLVLLGAGTVASQYGDGKSSGGAKDLMLLNEVLGVVSEYYVDEIPPEDLILEATHGLVESLDPHSQLLDQSNHNRLMEQTRGEFGGIGIEISIRDDTLTVLAPIAGTPASRVGLQSGDRIVRIEDEPTQGMSLEDAVQRLKGKPGTTVNIWIHRLGVDEDIHFAIVRAIIKIESVQGKYMLTPEIGYVRLSVFSDKSSEELYQAITELKALGMKRLIFDLRDNPGGLLTRAVDISDMFLDKGQVIVSTRGRIRTANKVFYAEQPALWGEGPVIALISGGSASASEIVAGALQDHDKAVLMGQTTYGKGSVQTLIDLREDYALKLTTAKYYTPSGRCIHSDENAGEAHRALLTAEDTTQTFSTDSGRRVRGGGGITPDLVLQPDTLRSVEKKIFQQLGQFRNLMFRYAVEYRSDNAAACGDSIESMSYLPNFRDRLIKITPEMVGRVRQLMREHDFDLTDQEFAQADELIRQWIYYYIADGCYDRNTAQRVLSEFDEQLLKALEVMKSVPDEKNFVHYVLDGRTLPDTLHLSGLSR